MTDAGKMAGVDIQGVENGIGMPSLWKSRELQPTIQQSFLQQKQKAQAMSCPTVPLQARMRMIQAMVK